MNAKAMFESCIPQVVVASLEALKLELLYDEVTSILTEISYYMGVISCTRAQNGPSSSGTSCLLIIGTHITAGPPRLTRG